MPLKIQLQIVERNNDIVNQLGKFTTRMTELKIAEETIRTAEAEIRKILLGRLLASLLKNRFGQ